MIQRNREDKVTSLFLLPLTLPKCGGDPVSHSWACHKLSQSWQLWSMDRQGRAPKRSSPPGPGD